ncbi:hypothetical protein Q1695_013818 [Nippostrongylus brasiliensis]|nr:hypothetical protein Q1695_013818 [Nippostrongylus brasiliensis]
MGNEKAEEERPLNADQGDKEEGAEPPGDKEKPEKDGKGTPKDNEKLEKDGKDSPKDKEKLQKDGKEGPEKEDGKAADQADPERQDNMRDGNFHFNDDTVRRAFVRKVFLILTIMLLTCCAMMAPVLFVKELKMFLKKNVLIQFAALAVWFITYYILMCCHKVARHYPWNIILLSIFTLASGVFLMVLCARVAPAIIAITLPTTALSSAAIILFACVTTIDITSYMFIIFAAGVVVFIFVIAVSIASFFIDVGIMNIVASGALCILFMVYLALDTQMVVGGRKHQISPEEYVYAALILFVDIFEIFINMTNIANAAQR